MVPGPTEQTENRGGESAAVATPTEPRPSIPQAAPFVLDQLFRLGALTSRMARELHYEPISLRGIQNVLKKLSDTGLVTCMPMIVQSSPAVANLEDPDGSAETFFKPRGLRSHEKVYELTDEGKSFVAGDQELPGRRVHQLYNRSHSPGRRQHSLLRNEYIVNLHEDEGGALRYRITGYWGEGGSGPIQLEKRERMVRSLTPDGLVMLENRDGTDPHARALFIESDTGNQRGAHVLDKIHQYSELYLAELLSREPERPADQEERKLLSRVSGQDRWLPAPLVEGDGKLMPVVFVSYYGQRTKALRDLITKAAKEDGMFKRLGLYMDRRGMGSAANVFLCTNLQALRRRGSWTAYWTAAEGTVRPLL